METSIDSRCVKIYDGGEDALVLRSEDVNKSTDPKKPEEKSIPDEFLFEFLGGEEVVETLGRESSAAEQQGEVSPGTLKAAKR